MPKINKMAPRKTAKKSSHDGPKAIVVFWIIFVVVIVSIAVFNWGTITRNFNLFKTRLTTSPGDESELLIEEIDETTGGSVITPEVVITEPGPRPAVPVPSSPAQQTPQSETQTSQSSATPSAAPASPAAPTAPAASATPSSPAASQTTQPTASSAQTRERSIYFAQVNSDGQILQSKVTRRFPQSDTPMQDVLNAMLAGPTATELRGNNLNLIPQNTRLLSATVRGSTAYLNFSEDFMFNTFGVEGYVAQVRQIVWTATEFPNVRDVQILIEGNRVDYLAEGIWIGSPIGRQ